MDSFVWLLQFLRAGGQVEVALHLDGVGLDLLLAVQVDPKEGVERLQAPSSP
jgi:hypothetical protein